MRWLLAIGMCLPALPQQLAVGNVLVATSKIQDPDFAHTVILLIRYDQQSAVGLTVNRPSDVPVSELYPELKHLRPITFYAGGPIAIGVRALLRSRTPPTPAQRVFGDVFLITKKQALTKLIQEGTPSSSFRVYAGSAGWTVPQLNGEVMHGLWRIAPADAGAVFDLHPETLWQRIN
jgi:putative transcriptional regulator